MTQRLSTVFFVVGSCCVVLGGLVAAATGPLNLTLGSWLAAYLVLVCGAAQCVVGRAQRHLAVRSVSDRLGWAQFGCWNLGNLAVILGTLATVPVLVDIGGAILLIALIIAFRAVLPGRGNPVLRWAYRAALVVLIISIPIGLVLGHLSAR